MNKDKINHVVIVGGGTAGWISAAILTRMLGKTLRVTLVESDDIGTVGVGEATIPPIMVLNNALGIDQADFMSKTNATIKLGIEFENWRKPGHSYMHAFGKLGKDFPFCGFEQLWLRGLQAGYSTDFWDYSLNYQAAKQGKFAMLDKIPKTDMQGLVYAFHFDAGLYARYLRGISEQAGVSRVEGTIEQVKKSTDGNIESVVLKSGETIAGDLFLDCSGFKGLLINEALEVGYEDWQHWLPCDRAIAVQSQASYPVKPYTQSIAHEAGWRWRIPLTKRTGNGVVYSSRHISDDDALDKLLTGLDGEPTTEPRYIRFSTGRRTHQWHKNCIAVGLSAGFLEPLESTSIHLIQTAVIRLLKLFPHDGIKEEEINEFNRQSQAEIEHIRDFIILHYHVTERDDSEFWRDCRNMQIPTTLHDKIELFRTSGKVANPVESLFSDEAWQQVLIGQGVVPQDYHPLADAMTEVQLAEYHRNVKSIIAQVVEKLPKHQDFLDVVNSSPQ